MKKLLTTALALSITACAGTGQGPQEPYSFATPPGSYFTLLQPVESPRENTTIYIQHGRILPSNTVEEWAPHCFFELYTLVTEPRVVEPDEFEIQRVTREANPLWVGLPTMVAYGGGADGGPTQLFYRTRFYISSPTQEDVWRLTCQIDRMEAQGPSYDKWLTVDQVRETLEGLFTLTVKDAAPMPGDAGDSPAG